MTRNHTGRQAIPIVTRPTKPPRCRTQHEGGVGDTRTDHHIGLSPQRFDNAQALDRFLLLHLAQAVTHFAPQLLG